MLVARKSITLPPLLPSLHQVYQLSSLHSKFFEFIFAAFALCNEGIIQPCSHVQATPGIKLENTKNLATLTVNTQFAMADYLLNLALLLQFLQRFTRQASIYLQAIHQCSDGNQAVGLYIFVELI